MLSVSVMSLWTGLNEASLETTAAAKEDMTVRWEMERGEFACKSRV